MSLVAMLAKILVAGDAAAPSLTDHEGSAAVAVIPNPFKEGNAWLVHFIFHFSFHLKLVDSDSRDIVPQQPPPMRLANTLGIRTAIPSWFSSL